MANKFEQLIFDAKKNKVKQYTILSLGALFVFFLIAFAVFYLNAIKIIVNPPEANPFSLQLLEGSGFRLGDRFVLRGSDAVLRVTSLGFQDEIVSVTSETKSKGVLIRMLYEDVRIDIKHEAVLASPRWEIDGILVSEQNNPSLYLPPGEFSLSVSSRYHKSITRNIKVLPEFVKSIQFVFKPIDVELEIKTNPTDALVFIDGQQIGTTPFNGTFLAGKKKLEIRKEGYQPYFEMLELYEYGEIQLKNVTLQAVQRLIPVKYSPKGGNLFLDGNLIKLEELIEVPRESKSLIRYEALGYQSKEIKVSELTKTIDFTLEPIYATLKLSSVPISSIFVGDKYVGKTPEDLKLLAKKNFITLRADGYVPYSFELDLKESSSNSYEAELTTLKDYRLINSKAQFSNLAGVSMKRFIPTKMNIGAPRGQKGQMANEQLRTVDFDRGFYISEFEITNKQFSLYSGSALVNNLPVKAVSWEQAALFCNWLSKQDGLEPFYKIRRGRVIGFDAKSLGYRLPTEAEWEYVARLANREKTSIFVWGDEYEVPTMAGNLADLSAKGTVEVYLGDYDDKYTFEAPVGTYGPEISGVYDMAGNVSEWVHDYYSLEPPDMNRVYFNYMGPEYGESRVVKGSNYTSSSWTELRASFKQSSQEARSEVGFRVARYLN